jgi:Carboxypeptidase regulatory-like domain
MNMSMGRCQAAADDFPRAGHLVLAVVLLIGPAGAHRAEACSCAANPPCATVWRADAVFVGTVVDRVQEPVGGALSWTVFNVSVNQRLHGAVDSSFITLVPGHRPSAEHIERSKSSTAPLMVSSSCDYNFEPGRQYVIYARKTVDGRWTTSECTGTKRIENAAEDFDYIASIPAAEPTGRVYGSIDRTVINPAKPASPEVVPAGGITVALTSESARLTATTDSEGKLDVRVPPGDYAIAPVVPQGVRVYGAPFRASVPARGCAPVHFSLTPNGRIEGRVVRPDGTPVARTSVTVVPADLPADKRPDSLATSPSGTTDERGRFSVNAILPGRYVVAVNAYSGSRLSSPYPTTYFPGVSRQDARVVEIGEGERKTGFTIVVSPIPETTVSGVVVFDDDRPAGEVYVAATPVDHRDVTMGSTKTDGGGAFELRLLAGISYLIQAGTRTENGLRQTETVVLVDQRLEGLRLSIVR